MKKSLLIAAFVPFMAAVAAEEKSKDPAAEAAEKSTRVQAMADLLAEHGCPRPVAPVEGQSFVFD